VKKWRRWVARHRGTTRDSWIAAGFVAGGYRVPALQQHHAWELVRAAAGPDHYAYNARSVLARLFNHQEPRHSGWTNHRACRFWLRWLKRHSRELQLGRPPERTKRACGG